jgi:anion-transporting  ArsA/GET3 family ATPase
VLLTGKVMEAATRERRGGGRLYDAVVLDAPPTGRISKFLNVNTEVAALARMGPVSKQANSVMELLRSPRTAVHLVTVLEEMPVQETADGVAELVKTGLRPGAVIVNMVRDPLIPADRLADAAAGRIDQAEIARGLKAAGLEDDATTVSALTTEVSAHAQRVQLEQQELATLSALDRPTYQLPFVSDAAELSGLQEIADRLQSDGMV